MSTSGVIAVLIVVAAVYYAWFVLRVFRGLGRIGHDRTPAQQRVSIIVAARNEEVLIDRCITSILDQEYPGDKIELLVVDDMSDDTTASIVTTRHQQDPRIRLITLPPRDGLVTGRKPEAIALGVSVATGEVVITTDADCVHGPRWIASMLSRFTGDTALVAGPVTLEEEQGLFSRIERLDFLGLIVSGAGLIGAGRPIICNGANLAYRKSAYDSVRDNVQISSNDDGTLMSRIVTRGIGSVRFALDPDAVVRTKGMSTVRNYFRQRMRWASVRGRFLDPTVYAELAGLFLFFALLLGGTMLSFFDAAVAVPVIVAWAIKVGVDGAALRRGSRNLGIAVSPFFFTLAQVFHPFAIVLSTLLSIVSSFTWKGRRLRR